ncbi:MAG: hypothetical protein OXB88_01760 [Bacteriovoracales bacterium]|nr:hypothetical protein [Bacteriovoracales bacterium]
MIDQVVRRVVNPSMAPLFFAVIAAALQAVHGALLLSNPNTALGPPKRGRGY